MADSDQAEDTMNHTKTTESQSTIPISSEALDTLALCAFRYAMGRKTYIVGDVCDLIERLPISPRVVALILSDIRSAKERDDFARDLGEQHSLPLGMDCDRHRLLQLHDRLSPTS
jgi:hypothetical protein